MKELVKFTLVVATFLFFVTSVHANAQNINQENDTFLFLMGARNAAKAGLTNKAIQRYEAYLKIEPDDKVVEQEFADFLHNKGFYQKAEVYYENLIQSMENILEKDEGFSKKLLLNAARNAVQNKKDERAIGFYQRALLSGKVDPDAAAELAGVLAGLERFEEALELCEKILQHDPGNSDIITLKTDILVYLKKFDAARESLANIPSEEKNTLKLQQLEADIEAWSGNYDSAIEKYQNLTGQYPEDKKVWSQYFRVLSWAKKWPFIVKTAEEKKDIVEITDDDRPFLAEAYLSMGDEEKAIEVWNTIQKGSDVWRKATLVIADKYLSQKNLTKASYFLEEILLAAKSEAHLTAKLALIYAYREMYGKAFETLNRFPVTSQTKSIIDVARVEILTLAERYEEAMAVLKSSDKLKEVGFRPQILELECYYALEKDEILLEKTSLLLQNPPDEPADVSKVLTLRILSEIRMGKYEEAAKDIRTLARTMTGDTEPAILVVLLNDARRSLNAYEQSIQTLGKLLSEFSAKTEMVRPKLLEEVPPSAWRVADDLALHHNQEVRSQLAGAELKAGNFQKSLTLYKELDEKYKDPAYKLGMIDCCLNLKDEEAANKIFNKIQPANVPEREMPPYLESLVTLKRDKQVFIMGLASFPDDILENVSVKATTIVANTLSDDTTTASKMVEKYLSSKQEDMVVFESVIKRVGYFDKGRNYEFAKNWLQNAVEQFLADKDLRYQYAKLLATHNEYDPAIEQFLTLQKDSTEDVRLLRWLAQVNSWKHEEYAYRESLKWYELYLKERPSDFKGRLELARLHGWTLHLQEANKAYKNLCEDYPEDSEVYWEWQAKKNNWLGRRRTAISFYDKLAERHPKDTEVLFDLGQMYSMLNFSLKAEDTYDNLLVFAPEHNRALFAKESEQWRRKQSLGFKQSYIHQQASADSFGNFEITMFRTDVVYSPVRLSEAMDLSVGLGNTIFKFKEHGGSTAEHLTFHTNKGFENGITTYMDGELSTYSEDRHETVQFEGGVNYRIFDMFSLTYFGGREDVLQNFNTLNNNRARSYTGGLFSWDVTQRIDILSQLKEYWYDDGNNGIEYYNAIGYKLLLYPRILKCIVDIYGFDTHTNNPEYWSPDNYQKYSGGLLWRHYLGNEHYSGAPKLYYEVALKQGVDNDGIDFFEPKFEFGWDNQRRWNVGFEIRPMRSTVYDEEQANAFLNIRF